MRAARPRLSGRLLDPPGDSGARGMIVTFFPFREERERNRTRLTACSKSLFFGPLDFCDMTETIAVIPAAGRGVRMGRDKPKQFLELAGRPVLSHTLAVFSQVPFVKGILLVVPADFVDRAEIVARSCREELLLSLRSREAAGEGRSAPAAEGDGPVSGNVPPIRVIPGGAERQDSVYNALQNLPDECRWVMIHDGVRPFASLKLIEDTWMAAQETGASIAALPATDTIKRVLGGKVAETISRDEIWLVQTPQVFRKDLILEAYRQAKERGWAGTDDAFFVERLGVSVAAVKGEATNIKVTTPGDLEWAEWYLAGQTAARGES